MIQTLWVPTEISAKLVAVKSLEFVKLNIFINICLAFISLDAELGAPSLDSDIHSCYRIDLSSVETKSCTKKYVKRQRAKHRD